MAVIVIPALNQFTGSGLLLLAVGGVMAYLRNIPVAIWKFIVRQTTVTITVKDDDSAFEWMKEWIHDQDFAKKVRRVDLDSGLRGKVLALMPAPGDHFFWFEGRPFQFIFTRSEEAKGKSWDAKRAETLTLKTIGRKQTILQALVGEIVSGHTQKTKESSKLYVYGDYWKSVRAYSPRTIESIILKEHEKENLLADIERFLKAKKRYKNLGIPYHRGYIFYGPPGTGKTSLVSALASHFGMSIYILDLSSLTDGKLQNAVNDVPENSIVLFEDIDCVGINNRDLQKAKNAPYDRSIASSFSVTLSGLLNVLDGFYAPDNVLFIMTTNNIDSLDSALLRPGRIDYKLHLDSANLSQKKTLYQRFLPECTEKDVMDLIASRCPEETMADVQGFLLSKMQKYPLNGQVAL